MLSYATVGTNDTTRAKAFYDALLAPQGFKSVVEHPSGGRIYHDPAGTLFAVLGPYDGEPATVGNGAMIGFGMKSREEVKAFHALALSLGATDEGAAGPRGGGEDSPFYFAYARDLDGNKISAFHLSF